MFEFVSVFVMGAVISGGLIIAIGSQNAFLLKTGLTNNHPFAAATVCFIGDILLIGAYLALARSFRLKASGGKC